MPAFGELFGSVLVYIEIIFRFWWIWSAPLTVALFIPTLLSWRQALYKRNVDWSIYELRMPREIDRSPKAMEQFFAALYGLRNTPGDFLDKYQTGEVTLWFSFELVSLEGDLRFFIRIPTKHARVVLGNLYANYQTIDIEEVADYMDKFPVTVDGLSQHGYDIWSAEFKLNEPDVHPLRTYEEFEDIEDAMNIDPIAGFLETFSRLSPGENVMLQILVRPADILWKEKAEKTVEELKKKGTRVFTGPSGEYEDKPIRTPGEIETLKSIERKMSKPPFETTIRYIYVAKQELMNLDFARRSMMSAFNQFASPTSNTFARNPKTTTDIKWTYRPWIFSQRRLAARKRRMYYHYRTRAMPAESRMSAFLALHPLHFNLTPSVFVLSSEELASIYHPPTKVVLTGQLIERAPSKRLGPPLGLPIFRETR